MFGAPVYLVIYYFVWLFFDALAICAARLLVLIKESFTLLNMKIKSIRSTEGDEIDCHELFEAYKNMLKCYNNFILTYQLPVSTMKYFGSIESF